MPELLVELQILEARVSVRIGVGPVVPLEAGEAGRGLGAHGFRCCVVRAASVLAGSACLEESSFFGLRGAVLLPLPSVSRAEKRYGSARREGAPTG